LERKPREQNDSDGEMEMEMEMETETETLHSNKSVVRPISMPIPAPFQSHGGRKEESVDESKNQGRKTEGEARKIKGRAVVLLHTFDSFSQSKERERKVEEKGAGFSSMPPIASSVIPSGSASIYLQKLATDL
jgi:hypothetical protein